MARDAPAALSGHDGGAGDPAAKAVAQNGKLVQSLGADGAGFAAYEERGDAARRHDINVVRDAVALKPALPINHRACMHVIEQL